MSFDAAARIADAVLYEGYALYPYRPSAAKNRVRWQFGVLMPRGLVDAGLEEPWLMQTECLIEPGPGATVEIDVRVRALHLQSRTIEVEQAPGMFGRTTHARVDGRDLVEWDEGIARTVEASGWRLARLLEAEQTVPISFEAGHETESAIDDQRRAVRATSECRQVRGRLTASAEPAGSFVKLCLKVANLTDVAGQKTIASRDEAVRVAMLGVHTLVAIRGGRFVSLLDPPAGAEAWAAACENRHTWPVLVGDSDRRDLLLSAPIILYDYPVIAPESPGNLFDATEIDEILSLRVMTLTDAEKAEARATDARVREIIDRTDALSAAQMAGLHGTMREGTPERPDATNAGASDEAWRELLNPAGEASPEEATVDIRGTRVARDSRVRLEPTRRADPIDLIVRGRTARVRGVYHDLDGGTYLAVVLDDDPAADLQMELGRFLYYAPDEVVPV
jgi:hypothetical protein